MSQRRKNTPAGSSSRNGLFPDEDPDIRKEVAALIPDAADWLNTPNTRLGGERPEKLIGTEREQLLRDLLRALKYGIPT